jgi:hypothetical protein
VVRDLDAIMKSYGNGTVLRKDQLIEGMRYRIEQLRSSGEQRVALQYEEKVMLLGGGVYDI